MKIRKSKPTTAKKTKRLVFYTRNLGSPIDKLTRDDIYEIPKRFTDKNKSL